MTDLNLQAKLEVSPSTMASEESQLEKEIEKEINNYVDKRFSFEDHPSEQLINNETRKTRLKEELKSILNLTELRNYIYQACLILKEQGLGYLQETNYNVLISDLETAQTNLNSWIANKNYAVSFEKLGISSISLDSIAYMAVEKFKEEKYFDALALYLLLLSLMPNSFECYYRAGITAQKLKEYNLAIKLYQSAISIKQEQLGPKIFMLTCYSIIEQFHEAKKLYQEIIEKTHTDRLNEWKTLLETAKNMIATK